MALEMVMRRAKVNATVHGFRSAFRGWSGERTAFPREVAEAVPIWSAIKPSAPTVVVMP
jgi:hypothetical protein